MVQAYARKFYEIIHAHFEQPTTNEQQPRTRLLDNVASLCDTGYYLRDIWRICYSSLNIYTSGSKGRHFIGTWYAGLSTLIIIGLVLGILIFG